MELLKTPIAGCIIIQHQKREDSRGFFYRLFCPEVLAVLEFGQILQVNHSATTSLGAVRGMHYQSIPSLEKKIVHCVSGAIFDVVVDLRRGSETYLQWFGAELTKDNARSLFIPEGCAHGFQALHSSVQMIYLHSELYRPEHEGSVNLMDPRVGIKWPLPFGVVSEKDKGVPFLNETFKGLKV